MKHSLTVGLTFGLTSGIITTLGLMVGLSAGTHSTAVVLGGIVTIAIADAFSDAAGIHISEESENRHTTREIWEATVFTFISKFVFASTFIIPVLLFELSTAVLAAIIWGLALLATASFIIAREQKANPIKVIAEHLGIMVAVVLATNYAGAMIAQAFG